MSASDEVESRGGWEVRRVRQGDAIELHFTAVTHSFLSIAIVGEAASLTETWTSTRITETHHRQDCTCYRRSVLHVYDPSLYQ